MNARVLLNAVRALVLERIGAQRYGELIDPPTLEEKRAARLEELHAAGLLRHSAVEVA